MEPDGIQYRDGHIGFTWVANRWERPVHLPDVDAPDRAACGLPRSSYRNSPLGDGRYACLSCVRVYRREFREASA